ncbi:MAG: chorismate mutase [Alphaproteobacteria bacterium]|nr:chorismate mutase [Alphaproteobacteria bacterium]
MTASNTDHLLASIRQEIDEIDDQLVQLILRRLTTSARVRDIKGGAGGMTVTPYRPAREAQIMRRLAAQTVFGTASAALTRLWRVILSASINAQAAVTLHVEASVGQDIDCRLMIADQFCGMAVTVHPDVASVVGAVGANPVDLAILDIESSWVEVIAGIAGSTIRVLAGLPSSTGAGHAPRLLVAGHCTVQPSGDDVTVLVGRGPMMDDCPWTKAWEVQSNGWTVTGVNGFVNEDDPAFASFAADNSHLQFRIAGSIPILARAK